MYRQPGLRMWLWWVLGTFVVSAGCIAVLNVQITNWPDYNFRGDNQIFPLVYWCCGLFVVLGPILGGTQGLVIWKTGATRDLLLWVVATTIAVIISLLLSVRITVLIYFVPGLVVGLAQWGVLQRRARYAYIWPIITTIGWFLGILPIRLGVDPLFSELGYYYQLYSQTAARYWTAGWALGTFIYASITGLALIWIVRDATQAKYQPGGNNN